MGNVKTPEELLKYTGALYNEIHKDDRPPQNEREKPGYSYEKS